MQPAGQDPEAPPGARNGHTTALFADECQSFLDNVIAGFAPSGSCNDPAWETDAPAAVAGVEEAIQAGGAELRYLPQYSPEFNPIELVFHPLKASLRKAAERTIEGLERRIGSFIRALDPSECIGYFRHAGYEPL